MLAEAELLVAVTLLEEDADTAAQLAATLDSMAVIPLKPAVSPFLATGGREAYRKYRSSNTCSSANTGSRFP